MTDSANPLMRPMTTVLDRSVRAAKWLESSEWSAGIALARAIAGQIDDVTEAGHVNDPEVLKQLHMRMIPNFQRALFTLGLTPEGFAKITAGVVSGTPEAPAADGAESAPAGVATPFAAASAAAKDPLDALIIDMDSRR